MQIAPNQPSTINELLAKKPQSTLGQLIRYAFVGGVAAVMDTACLYILYSFGLNHLVSAAAGFIVGLLTNYLMSIAWVFNSTGRFKEELAIFAVIGISGLAWTELILWIAMDLAQLPVLKAKAISLILVLVWNFGMRKRFVFSPLPKSEERPPSIAA